MQEKFRAAMVVAHPDDEVIWGGGLLLNHPEWEWQVASLCRGGDPDRAPRFFASMEQLGYSGTIADLDDGPDQQPLSITEIDQTIKGMLKHRRWNLVVTHGPRGEYTRHRRHEEVCDAVVRLWETGRLLVGELRMFAYGDNGGTTAPRAVLDANLLADLDAEAWKKKYEMITETYGFSPSSWEARIAPSQEAFWIFHTPSSARRFIELHPEITRVSSIFPKP